MSASAKAPAPLPSEASALIGHTGFVGGTLAAQTGFGATFNSSTIAQMAGRHFDLVVCAGVSAAKWIANADPAGDVARIRALTDVLATIRAEEFILISTIDVYPAPDRGGDETTRIDVARHHAYGRNRFELERWVTERFATARIVRLPALFGAGLRKNAVHDLLKNHETHKLNPNAAFQWYPMRRLWADVETVRRAGLPLVNLFTAPLTLSEIIDAFFPDAAVGPRTGPAVRYDVRTCYAELFGGANGYMLDEVQCLGELARYIAAARTSGP